MSKRVGRNLSGKYRQKLLNHAKQSATDAIKNASKTAIQKTAGPTGDLISNEIVDTIIKLSRTFPQNSLEIVLNETENIGLDREIPRKKNIYIYIYIYLQ